MGRSSQHPGDRLLIGAMDRELDASSRDAVTAHLSDCEACRRRAAALLALSADLRAMLRDGEPLDADDASRHRRERVRLMFAMRSHDARTIRGGGSCRRRPAAIAAVAAAGMLALMVLHIRTRTPDVIDRVDATLAGALPITQFTPGATASLSASQLCAGERPTGTVAATVAERVVKAYNMEGVPRQDYELDALITPELGGTADAANLWPQRYRGGVWNARVKDEIEDYLREAVCSGRIDLRTAQRDIATNWVAAYQKYFHRSTPLAAIAEPGRAARGGRIVAVSYMFDGGP